MRIHALTLTVPANQLATLHAFYADSFGLTAALTDTTLTIGESVLRFVPGAANPATAYHFALNIPPDRFDAARVWLAARTPLVQDATGRDRFRFENWNADACYFRDPAGNIGELIARHDLPMSGRIGDFSPDELLCVSEIGLCSGDVPGLARRLAEALEVEPYRGGIGESFTPMGDTEGLFILVKEGRAWYPDTGVPALPLPIEMTASGRDGSVTVESAEDGEYAITPA